MDNFWNKKERGRDGGGGEIPAKYLEYKPEGVKREREGAGGGGQLETGQESINLFSPLRLAL